MPKKKEDAVDHFNKKYYKRENGKIDYPFNLSLNGCPFCRSEAIRILRIFHKGSIRDQERGKKPTLTTRVEFECNMAVERPGPNATTPLRLWSSWTLSTSFQERPLITLHLSQWTPTPTCHQALMEFISNLEGITR